MMLNLTSAYFLSQAVLKGMAARNRGFIVNVSSTRAATPMGRLGTSQEIVDAVVFWCSDQASFLRGQVIEINGGFLMA